MVPPPTMPPAIAKARERAIRERERDCAAWEQRRHLEQRLTIAERVRRGIERIEGAP